MQRPLNNTALATARMGIAAALLAQAAHAAPAITDISRNACSMPEPRGDAARLRALVDLLAPLGVSPAQVAMGAGVVYLIALVALLLGIRPRPAAAVAWIAQLFLLDGAPGARWGVDEIARSLLVFLGSVRCGGTPAFLRRRGARAP